MSSRLLNVNPNSFFGTNLDYIFFFYGLSFILLAVVCLLLNRRKNALLPWRWLALFCLLHGVYEWTDWIALCLGEGPVYAWFRLALLGSSFIFLCLFGLHGLLPARWRLVGSGLILGLLALASLGLRDGRAGLGIALRYWLCLPGGLLAAVALGKAARTADRGRGSLAVAAVGMAFYAVAAGLIVAKAAFFPASRFNVPDFFLLTGVPIQLVRGLLAILITIAVWRCAETIRRHELALAGIPMRRRPPTLLIALLFLAITGGWYVTDWVGRFEFAQLSQDYLNRMNIFAGTVHKGRLDALAGSRIEPQSPGYLHIQQKLLAACVAQHDACCFYLVSRREGKTVVAIEVCRNAALSDAPEMHPSGSVLENPPPELLAVLAGLRGPAVCVHPNAVGEEILSAYVPLGSSDAAGNQFVFASDALARPLRYRITGTRIAPIGITLVICLLIITLFYTAEGLRYSAEQVGAAEHLYQTLVEGSPNCVNLFDSQGRVLSASQNGLDLLGLHKADLLGRCFVEVWPEASRPTLQDAFDRVLAGRRDSCLCEYLRPDGAPLMLKVVLTPVLDARHQVNRIVGITMDVTEIKRVERQLRESNERYQSIFENAHAVMLIIEPNTGDILDANPAAAEYYGYSRRQLLSMKITNLNRLTPAEVNAEMRRSAARECHHFFFQHQLASGESRDVEVYCGPIQIGGRQVLYSIIHDITERQAMEAQLREAEERYRTLFEQSPDGVLIIDPETSLPLEFNDTACRQLGYTREEFSRLRVTDYNSAKSSEEIAQNIAMILDRGGAEFETCHCSRDGVVRDVLVGVRRIQLSHRPLLLCVYRDITERKQAAEERQKLEEQVRQTQKLESLGVLAGGIAHDFNNLLVGILGYAELAFNASAPDSPARDSLDQILTASRRAADLTRQMLAYSGRGKFLIEKVSLPEVVKEMSQLLEVSISKKCRLNYRFAETLPPIEGDVTQLRQIIMNLITNASDAIGDRSGAILIGTSLVHADHRYLKDTYLGDDLPEGAYVMLEVTDTGCGMDEATRSKIFDPFFTTKFTGRGLGLAAVLGIVRGHRGAIRIQSEPGRGTTFQVLLPAAAGLPTPAASKAQLPARPRGEGTILVIDDEPAVCALAKTALERNGFTVLTAEDGCKGLALFQAHLAQVDAVLLDMTMPQMDGVETFTELRRLRPDVRVILSSGYNRQEATERLGGEELVGFIQKPYRPSDLLNYMHTVLQ